MPTTYQIRPGDTRLRVGQILLIPDLTSTNGGPPDLPAPTASSRSDSLTQQRLAQLTPSPSGALVDLTTSTSSPTS